jgi:hypothetical protein
MVNGYNQAGPDDQEVITKLSIEVTSVICDAYAEKFKIDFFGQWLIIYSANLGVRKSLPTVYSKLKAD